MITLDSEPATRFPWWARDPTYRPGWTLVAQTDPWCSMRGAEGRELGVYLRLDNPLNCGYCGGTCHESECRRVYFREVTQRAIGQEVERCVIDREIQGGALVRDASTVPRTRLSNLRARWEQRRMARRMALMANHYCRLHNPSSRPRRSMRRTYLRSSIREQTSGG